MTIICNLRSMAQSSAPMTDYTITDTPSYGYVHVVKRNLGQFENAAGFDVETGDVINVRKIEGGEVEYFGDALPHLQPKNARPFDAEQYDMNDQRRPQ